MHILLKKPEDFQPKRTIVGCAIEHDGHILMLHRSANETQPNTWCVPGGKLEAGETPHESVMREVEEETGISLTCNITHDGEYFVRSPRGDSIFHFFHYECETKHEVILSEREHQNHQWMKPEDALELDLIKGLDFNIKRLFGI